MSEVVELLLADYGLDPTRGGMLGTLATHVESRLAHLQISEAKFIERLRSDADERHRLIHAITVRHSWFYRDPGQLDGLVQRMLARRAELSPRRPLDVWIAGCAAGEEAWTIAMLAIDAGIDLRLRATDVDAFAIQHAQRGEYGAWSLRDLPERFQRYIEPTGEGRWRVGAQLRALDVEFVQHNLCDSPLPSSFDVICCRNVLIYFVAERAQSVVENLRATLHPGGEILLGAGDLMFRSDGRVRTPAPMTALPRPRVEPPVPKLTIVSNSRQSLPPIEIVPKAQSIEVVPKAQSVDLDQLEKAALAVDAGEYEPAIEQLAQVLEGDPLDAEAHLWTGIAQYGLGRGQLAAEALRRARCLAPQLWPATLFAALTNERRGLWSAATRCWAELERAISASDAPPIEGTMVLLDALPQWRAEALALARQRISKHADGRSHD